MKLKEFFLKSKKKKSFEEREQIALGELLNFLNISYDKSRMAEVTYFTCLKVLSEGLSKLPLALQKVTPGSGIVDMTGDTLWNTVRIRPNPYMTPSTFWTAIENNRNHYGNAYVYIERSTDRGINLWLLEPTNVRLYWDRLKGLSDVSDIYYIYTSPENGKQTVLSSSDVLHFKTSTTFGGIVGLSVQEKLKLSLDGALKSQEMLNKLYDQNFVPKIAVQFQPGTEVKDELKEQYLASLQKYADGKVEGTSSFMPVAYGTSLVPLNIKLTDGQFLELRKYTALQIASAFGIKPNHLNDYEKSSYANSETQQLAFYTDTMLYIIKQYEEELNYKLLSEEQRRNGYRFKFNIAAVLRGDTKSQVDSLTQGIANALYTPNEARRNLDLPSKEGGDNLFFNGSNIPITFAGNQYSKSAKSLDSNSRDVIININKFSDSQPRDEHGRWIDEDTSAIAAKYGLTDDEDTAIKTYMSSFSYELNEKLRTDTKLDTHEKKIADDLDSALDKMPKYEGTVYRSMSSDMLDDPKKFWQAHQPGKVVRYRAYTSTSLKVYDASMDIQCIIKSKNGRNVTSYNPKENEILFKRKTKFIVTKLDDNIIYLEEL